MNIPNTDSPAGAPAAGDAASDAAGEDNTTADGTSHCAARDGFDPFDMLCPPASDQPPEPPLGSVLGWMTANDEPAIAVRALTGWYLDRDEEPRDWRDVLATIGTDAWPRVGIAVAWRQLIAPTDDTDPDPASGRKLTTPPRPERTPT